jgi:hypothetical protein
MPLRTIITTSKSSDVTLHAEHHPDCTECNNGVQRLCTSIEMPGYGTVELVHHVECEACLAYYVIVSSS